MLHSSLITVLIFTIFNIADIHSYNATEECQLPNGKHVTIGQFLDKWNSQGVGSIMSVLNWTKVFERYQTVLFNDYDQNASDKAMELYTNVTAIGEIRPLDADALLTLVRNIDPDVTPCNLLTLINDPYFSIFDLRNEECELSNGNFLTISRFLEKWDAQGLGSVMSLLNFTKVYERYETELLNYYNQNGYDKSMELYTNAMKIGEIHPLNADALLMLARNIKPDVTPCNLLALVDDSYFSIFDMRNEKCALPNSKFVTIGQFLDKWNSEAAGSVMSLLNWTKVYEQYQTILWNYYDQNGFDKSMELYTNAATIAKTHPLDADALLTLAQNVKPDATPCNLLTLIKDSYLSSLSIQNEVCQLPNSMCGTVGQLLNEWNAQTFVGSVMSLVNWTKVHDQYHTIIMNYYNQNGFENSMELLTNANKIAGIRPLDVEALLTLAQNIKPDITICNLLALIDDYSYFYVPNLQSNCVLNFEK